MSAYSLQDPLQNPDDRTADSGADSGAALSLLPEPLRTVVATGHDILGQILNDAAATDVLSDLSKLHHLVEKFPEAPALRGLVRAQCAHLLAAPPEHPEGEELPGGLEQARRWAVALVGDETSDRAAAEVKAFLREQNKARNARARAARREARPSAEERAEERTEIRFRELREARDTARRRAAAADDVARELRERLAEVEEARRDAEQTHQSTLGQLAALRSRFADPVHLSRLLAQLLRDADSARDSHHPADSSPGRHRDPFGVLDSVPIAAPESDADLGKQQRGHLASMLSTIASPPVAYTADLALRVEVLGAGAEIGGSCVLVQAAGSRIVVDCGIRPRGREAATMAPPGYTTQLGRTIDAVVITHAHMDHAGWVPALLADRPGIPIYTTAPTCDLLATMWQDSAKVMASTGSRCYDQSDVRRAIAAFSETPLNQAVRVGELSIELFAAGHIVGAAGVVVSAGNERVVISGDVSGPGQETVGGFAPSAAAQSADLMLLESTYAGEQHLTSRAATVGEMMRTIERVVEREGVALVPAFALGRAQEVALLMRKHLPEVPVLIDGLARAVTEVYERHTGPGVGRRDIYSEKIRAVPMGGTEQASRSFKGGVVITTSGMLNQGPAVTWAKRVLPDPNSALMVVGYQDEETPGAKLLRLADAGGGEFDLPSRSSDVPDRVEVYADVARYQLGAHASADELAGIVTRTRPQELMLVHGERAGQERFRLRMTTRAQSTIDPGIWTA